MFLIALSVVVVLVDTIYGSEMVVLCNISIILYSQDNIYTGECMIRRNSIATILPTGAL